MFTAGSGVLHLFPSLIQVYICFIGKLSIVKCFFFFFLLVNTKLSKLFELVCMNFQKNF